MHQLPKSSLPHIAGGASAWQTAASAAVVAGVKQMAKAREYLQPSANNPFAGLENEGHGTCQCTPTASTLPKNGDRNSLGQIYSWGTWWDDTH